MIRIILAFSLLIMASGAISEMPKDLKGSWVLDADATRKQVMESPKWTKEGEKYLPRILNRMSQSELLFEDGLITFKGKVKKESIKVALKEGSKSKYVFDVVAPDRSMTINITFLDDSLMNFRPSSTDDMDLCIWKRKTGAEVEIESGSDAIELLKATLNNNSSQSKPAKTVD